MAAHIGPMSASTTTARRVLAYGGIYRSYMEETIEGLGPIKNPSVSSHQRETYAGNLPN